MNVELEKKNDVLRDVSDELALVEQSLENKVDNDSYSVVASLDGLKNCIFMFDL